LSSIYWCCFFYQPNDQCNPPDATGTILIEINKHNVLGRSYLQIASTIVHEAIHAELFRKRQEMMKSSQPPCQTSEPTSFEELWCYYLFYMTPLNSEEFHHEYMADHYVKTIALLWLKCILN
jgi:hypothetical protein